MGRAWPRRVSGMAALAALMVCQSAHAGDILRGGATMDASRRNAAARANSGAEAADLARRTAKDRLARTTRVVESLRRGASATGGSSIPNGLVPGGLEVANPLNWVGANLPTQAGAIVNIVQTEATARLYWNTFNVGRGTILKFDQSAGKDDTGKWIAFNHVLGNSASRIAGSILAPGQVYLENPNGIRFESGARVEARTFVATTLPINTNLIQQGLLNNRDAQFLFSALSVPGGSDGTSEFIPPPVPPGFRYGDVVVQAGALLQGPTSADGNGGRVMLVGANVVNEGVISTPAGQTILAAGLQVGVQAHRQDDPSLRGLDVWVGAVGDYAGRVTNRGLIEARTGSILAVGRRIEQLGAMDSSTTVNLNGRIDILASYGATANPNFDNDGQTGFGAPIFLNQFTGLVQFGPDSVTRILPDLESTKKVPGTGLRERSRINIEGHTVHFDSGSILLAPSALVSIRAGSWPYVDIDNNRTVFTAADPPKVETSLPSFFSGSTQTFFFNTGQVYVDRGALLDVSGTQQAFVPLTQHILDVQLRGAELADSPLLRNTDLRGLALVVDIRRSGIYGGRQWYGTPLGDLSGLLNIIERDVAQLTAMGGTLDIRAGNAIIVREGATLDVSGGSLQHEGGRIQTSRLLRGGRHIIPVDQATPDVTYDGVYTGQATHTSAKWGVTKTYAHALAPLGSYNQKTYIEGAAGGTMNFTAPTLILEGTLLGRTIKGPRQQESPPEPGKFALNFRGQKRVDVSATVFRFLEYSPVPPEVRIVDGHGSMGTAPPFTLVGEAAPPVAASAGAPFTIGSAIFTNEGGGFGRVEIDNREGDVVIGGSRPVVLPAGGALIARAANVNVRSDLVAPGGTITLRAVNFSPFLLEELQVRGLWGIGPAPAPLPDRGRIVLDEGVAINVAGMMVDDRPTSPLAMVDGRLTDGGSITLEGYSVVLPVGSLLEASGGVWAKAAGGFVYGRGGDIAVLAGQDTVVPTSIGGELVLDGLMQAYGGRTGGTLTLKANQIQIGGGAAPDGGLLLDPSFFQQGGFRKFSLIGIGGRDAAGNLVPAVRLAAGTVIEPVSENFVLTPYARPRGTMAVRPFLKPVGIRPATSLSLEGVGVDDGFTTGVIEAIGLVVLEEGSVIRTDPGAAVSVKGQLVSVLGTIEAPGGAISITGAGSFPVPGDLKSLVSFALPTVYIGPRARLSAAGTTVMLPDPFGRRSGIIHPGGSIRISGNIFAEAGAVLDVSGTSAVLDFHPSRLGNTQLPLVPRNAGINTTPWGRRGVPVRMDSDGGFIELLGGEMLYSDATLIGRAGGPSALGGVLSVGSGRFYADGEPRTGADINLVVEQSGSASAFGNTSAYGDVTALMAGQTNLAALFAGGNTNRGIGYFSIARFEAGGFDSLDLGFEYFADREPIPFGGNVEFRGPVSITARGFVRVAGGGVIQADSPVTISAPYVAVGQEFRPPGDTFQPFKQDNPATTETNYYFPPTTGPGSLSIQAQLIDVGTLSLQGIGRALFAADGGDIRGSGTLNIAGDLTLRAAQVYPTTLATFNIFAYDPPGGTGSVTILQSGTRPMPLSAGGTLNIFASRIMQSGTLRAPLGLISLGWDGTDLDPDTAGVQGPVDPVGRAFFNPAGAVFVPIAPPKALEVVLASGSVTSVSAVDPRTGEGIVVPFGISPDGLSWIDPRGVNVTVGGLPVPGVFLAGDSVTTQPGSVIDLRGGGDLLAYRWVQGNTGSTDILGTAVRTWGAGGSYEAGELVLHEGRTWSARVGINPNDFATPPVPEPSRYWALVPESFAVIPGFDAGFAPFNVFNRGANSTLLDSDPGFVSSSLRLGEQIYLEASPGLPAGFHTLLPRRYAIYPGAFLVIPQEGSLMGSGVVRSSASPALQAATHPIGTAMREEGSFFVSGYTFNAFHRAANAPQILSRFELVPPAVLANRVEFELYSANEFMTEAARRLDVTDLQRLPRDSASLAIHGNNALSLGGSVLSRSISGGRGAAVDISSFADIYVIGGSGSAPPGATAVLDAALISSWGAESLLIGGLRSRSNRPVDVRTSLLVLDSPGVPLTGPDVTLVALQRLTMTAGSSLLGVGERTQAAPAFRIVGDGVLLRASADRDASVERSGLTGSVVPLLEIGAGARLAGAGVIVDSTYASDLDPSVVIEADTLTMAGGQISILLEPQPAPLPGTLVAPHLEIQGLLRTQVEAARRLTLTSYRTLDLYGDGTFGRADMDLLQIFSAGIRGFARGAGGARIQSRDLVLGNPVDVAFPAAAPLPETGRLTFGAETLRLGANAFEISGYQSVRMEATGGVLAEARGSLSTGGNLDISTPRITALEGANYAVTAGGSLGLLASAGTPTLSAGLGGTLSFTGADIAVSTEILLPSGLLLLRALAGDLVVTGSLIATGTTRNFYDLVRTSDAGTIELMADAGSVTLGAGSVVSVAGAAGGGRAGTVLVRSPGGIFSSFGELKGLGGGGGARDGTFLLDAGGLASFGALSAALDTGGFLQERNMRIRTGDVTVDGVTTVRKFILSADGAGGPADGNILVTGTINASGRTGGEISLSARGDLVIAPSARLSVAGQEFGSSGRGGKIHLEAGAQSDGLVNTVANDTLITAAQPVLDLQAGAIIDLRVAKFKIGDQIKGDAALELAEPNGRYTDPTSSAFLGQFQGTLHLRAPQILDGSSLLIDPIDSTILGASSILVEGYRLYDLTSSGGTITAALKDAIKADGDTFRGTSGSNSSTYAKMHDTILANNLALDPIVIFSPGAEIINRAMAASLNYSFDSVGSAITVIPVSGNGGGVTFTNGTPGDNLIRTDIKATVTSASGVTTTLEANTPTSLASGSTVSFTSEGKITFLSGSGGVMPVTLAPGSSYTQSSTGASGTVSAPWSVISLITAGSSEISLAAGTLVTLPNGTTGTDTSNRIRSDVAGTITAPDGSMTILAANVNTQVAEGSAIALDSAGKIKFAAGTGGPVLVALNSGSFTTSGATGLTPASGDLVLGTASTGLQNEDWDLSAWRYGASGVPGVLTLRATGDIVFNNTLSDGFNPVASNATNRWSTMWLATLQAINPALPLTAQSWSYRITAGADLSAADFRSVLETSALAPGKGSVLVGEFYPAIPNSAPNATGMLGLTSNTIGIESDRTRFEVIRTGTGGISIAAGRDVQLRNSFAAIYTAGVAVPVATTVFQPNDFVVPLVNRRNTRHPSQRILGQPQQRYSAVWSLAGGGIEIAARGSIRRTTRLDDGVTVVDDTSRQMPGNWLYRRGYVDPSTGLFSTTGGVDGSTFLTNINDPTPSTTWWIDFSNFFQGVGTLGGGDISLIAGTDIINVDAVAPTNARMAGRDPATGLNIAPNAANLLELGGGDLVVKAGRDISGGIYLVERGEGELFAGRDITTNAARSPSLYLLGTSGEPASVIESSSPAVFDQRTWLPTTLFAGKASFDVRARGDVLLGPVVNPFLLPQGLNNKFWYKTYFQTYSPSASVEVVSLGGSVTHRLVASPPGGGIEPILGLWLGTQNLYAGVASASNASNFQPWIRLAETDVSMFTTALSVAPPTLRSTAFGGDINIAGRMNLFPSPTGTLEMAATGAVVGLQPVGRTLLHVDPNTNELFDPPIPVTVWTSASVNLSDASPGALAGIASPAAYASLSTVGRNLQASRETRASALTGFDASFAETGSFSGVARSVQVQRALHDSEILHRNDREPLRIYSLSGDITGLTLFSPKFSQILAGRDISDVAFYLQNTGEEDVSIVAAGRDVVPNNANAPLRTLADDYLGSGNFVGDPRLATVAGQTTIALPGDIQLGGPGYLEVLARRNLDLGTGANLTDGRGVGITTIGNARNPFLPFTGAGLVVMAGVGGEGSGPALGLMGSTLNLESFMDGAGGTGSANPEVAAIEALDAFFAVLKQAGREFAETGNYDLGYAAIAEVFGDAESDGEIFTRARDIRTISGGGIRIAAPGGGITMASSIFGNPDTPPGIVTEYGGDISTFTLGSVDIGRTRIFTLRGGDITMWSSTGDIAAGTSPKTVVTAPPTRVLIDSTSADVQTDLGGLATGGGIGTLKLSEDDEESDVTLIAPEGTVDAGDAGIRATGNIAIAAVQVLNADNIAAGGTSTGVPTAPAVTAPNIGGLSSGASSTAATSNAASEVAQQARPTPTPQEESPSIIEVQVLGYGGEAEDDEDDEE